VWARGEGVGAWVRIFELRGGGGAPYIHRLTDEYSDLRLSVSGIFINFSTKKYSSVIFLGIKEYNKTEECIMFSVVLLKVRHIDFQQYYISKVMISSLFSP
jgi:hypothetical protein